MVDNKREISSMQTLADFVKYLRNKHSNAFVPNFDPKDGGENARILFLFEKPGRMTDPKNCGSGLISQDNNDATAKATKAFLRKAGINRKDIVLWNCISAWNGTRKIISEEREEAKTEISELLKILKKVSSIVLVGKVAERLSKHLDLSGHKVTFSMHPSPINRATRRKKWKKISEVWASAIPKKN